MDEAVIVMIVSYLIVYSLFWVPYVYANQGIKYAGIYYKLWRIKKCNGL